MGSKSPIATGKAASFAADAKEAGWEVKEEAGDKAGREIVIAEKDGAVLALVWDSNRYNYNESGYTADGHKRTVRNASEARRILSGEFKPQPGKVTNRQFAKKANAAAKAVKGNGGETSAAQEEKREQRPHKHLPFELESATDEEILKAVIGKKITWKNSISRNYESARVMANPTQRHLKIQLTRTGERCITWAAADESAGIGEDSRGPFRSVKLSSIISITNK